jgi:two-component system nitrate/nitrite response regulator NarP
MSETKSVLGSLSRREEEIAALIYRRGLSNKEIANQLGLTEGTVKLHVHSIFLKLGARSRAELILLLMTA